MIVGERNVWPRAPLVSEIKSGSGPNGLPPVYFRVLNYDSTVSTSGNLAWTTMGKGDFVIYVVAADNNPFDTCNFGSIVSATFSNEIPKWEQYLTAALLALLLIFSL